MATKKKEEGGVLADLFTIALAAVVVKFLYLPIGGMVIGSFLAFQSQQSYYLNFCDVQKCVRDGLTGFKPVKDIERVEAQHRAQAATVCPGYFRSNYVYRVVFNRSLAWCEDYNQFDK